MKIHPSSCIIPYWQQACRMPPLKTFTTGEDEPETVQHKIKTDPRARRAIGSIGRKIRHRIIHIIDENGENLGNQHRADVIRMMDERGIKIVPLNENADPPVYKLMTGKQIHEEQMKLREKQKAKLKTGKWVSLFLMRFQMLVKKTSEYTFVIKVESSISGVCDSLVALMLIGITTKLQCLCLMCGQFFSTYNLCQVCFIFKFPKTEQ